MKILVPCVLLVAALLVAPRSASAQAAGEDPIAKGRHWVGLTMGATNEHLENTSSGFEVIKEGQNASWQMALDYGWFVREGTSIGLGLEYRREDSDVTSVPTLGPNIRVDRGVSTATIGVHSSTYLPLGNPHFYLYNQTQISVGFTSGTEKTTVTETVESDISGQRYALDLQPGIAVMIARGFAVQASVNVLGLSYETRRTKTPGQPDAVTSTTALDFELDLLKLGIGLTYYF
jgi:hypothetical protein